MKNCVSFLALFALLILILSCSKDDATAPEEETFGMDDAIAVVIDSILDKEVSAGQQYRCIRMATSIPEGSVIEEYAPLRPGMPDAEQPAAVSMQTTERLYFFLLDLAPATMYEHDVKYITVDEGGDYSVASARWWPVINEETPEQFLVAEPAEVYVIASNVNIEIDPGQPPAYVFEPVFRQYKEGFIVVQGLMPSEALYSDAYNTYANGIDFFEA